MRGRSHKLIDLGDIESVLNTQGYSAVCGVDEAGRGPLAGPVVAAAVILPKGVMIEGLADSKKLSAARRSELFDEIVGLDLPGAVGIIDHLTIDTMNILRASLMAMHNAVLELKVTPDVLLVDGTFTIPNLAQPQYAIVEGDNRCRAIMAASIVAKVTRDRIMDEYERLYPAFSFSVHKGYPTAQHMKELEEHGPCEIHRKTFRPVARLIQEYALF
ncbi:ribonuclease HII [candidate division GN15 bacterium]|uniref:Ribonuclease HII n=1 Tax=candidate division GN15 bacterium TaxID=2072418 RepID=A0A855WXM0_9BACT|nr:MAG: ribonuclease HII [candidate division GN15 bacterium]